MSKIGRNIKKIRTVKKVNQNDFANLFGISRASVGAYEEGRAEPKIETILKISEHFKIPVDALLKKDLQVNDISNFKLDNEKLKLDTNNLTSGKKLILKEMKILSASTKKTKIKEHLRVPVRKSKEVYLAIYDNNISICRKTENSADAIGKKIYLEQEKSFVREEIVQIGEELKLKLSGEPVPESGTFYIIESEIISNSASTPNPANQNLEERIARLEEKLFGGK